MPIYEIETPDGDIWEIEGPENATDEQIIAFAKGEISKRKPGKKFKTPVVERRQPSEAEKLAARQDEIYGKLGAADLTTHGATLGMTDEAAGIGNALYNIVSSPFTDAQFDPVSAYTTGRDAQEIRINHARARTGTPGLLAEFAGGFGSGLGAGEALPTLGQRALAGVKAGATGGALAGFGYGRGAEGSALSAGVGASLGAAVGGTLPVLGEVMANRIDGLRRLTGRDPDLPRRLVGEAIQADGNTPAAVGQVMDQAHSRGSPMMLADTGENARSLLASVARQPGAARAQTRAAVTERQEGQGDRIISAIRDNLGDIQNPHAVADRLSEQARTAAAPLYEQAYASPIEYTPALGNLLARPAMRQALQRARRLAQEEGRDPDALALVEDATGEVTVDQLRQPTMQTLDYVKRGMDDVIERYRDSTTGRLNLDTEGRAVNNTQRSFINELDRMNPAYAQARAAYAGPIQGRAAMQTGLRALSKNADDITAQTQNMTPYELDMYRLGVRRAMADLVASKGDYANKVQALLGSPKKRQALERLFANQNVDRFGQALGDEAAAAETFQSVARGSQTAERMAFDQTTNDAGLAETAMDAALRGGKNGVTGLIAEALTALRDVSRFGPGRAGEQVRERAAALLTETDPSVLRELIRAAQRARAQQRVRQGSRSRKAVGQGYALGRAAGTTVGATQPE